MSAEKVTGGLAVAALATAPVPPIALGIVAVGASTAFVLRRFRKHRAEQERVVQYQRALVQARAVKTTTEAPKLIRAAARNLDGRVQRLRAEVDRASSACDAFEALIDEASSGDVSARAVNDFRRQCSDLDGALATVSTTRATLEAALELPVQARDTAPDPDALSTVADGSARLSIDAANSALGCARIMGDRCSKAYGTGFDRQRDAERKGPGAHDWLVDAGPG